MNEKDAILKAIREAEEFKVRAGRLLKLLQTPPGFNGATPLRSAMRRQSMDLTRALSVLRGRGLWS